MGEPIKANRKRGFDELSEPGDFMWSLGFSDSKPSRMLFVCPCGCGDKAGIAVKPESGGGPVWSFDGNLDSPTVTPSIRRIDNCQWHGYLTGGYFREC